MNQVHLIIGKERSSHCSFEEAIRHLRSTWLQRRVDEIDRAVETFVMEFLNALFLIK
jgi:hypothetical protein